MQSASPLPSTGEVFLDARGGARSLRVAWHPESGVVVLSLWRDDACVGTFRLPLDQVVDLVEALRGGPDGPRTGHAAVAGKHKSGKHSRGPAQPSLRLASEI